MDHPDVPKTQVVVQGNKKPSDVFAIEWLVLQGFPVSSLEPLLRRLRNRAANTTLWRVPFTDHLRAKVFAYSNDITIFVSHQSDINAMKKVVERYEEVAGAKINFNKSKGL